MNNTTRILFSALALVLAFPMTLTGHPDFDLHKIEVLLIDVEKSISVKKKLALQREKGFLDVATDDSTFQQAISLSRAQITPTELEEELLDAGKEARHDLRIILREYLELEERTRQFRKKHHELHALMKRVAEILGTESDEESSRPLALTELQSEVPGENGSPDGDIPNPRGSGFPVEILVLAHEITYGAGGPVVPVRLEYSTDGLDFNQIQADDGFWDLDEGDKATIELPTGALIFKGLSAYPDFESPFFNFSALSDGTNVITLDNNSPEFNLETLLTARGVQNPFGAQATIESKLPSSLLVDGQIVLPTGGILMLFELGTSNSSSAAFDFQDLIVLVNPLETTVDGVEPNEHRVFVTSTTHNGNLGGLAGADAICEARRQAAGLQKTYKAILSDSNTNAIDRLVAHGGGVFKFDDASNKISVDPDGNLWNGIQSQINLDEFGLTRSSQVWTGTDSNGVRFATPDGNCNDWTDLFGFFTGLIGETTSVPAWISAGPASCDIGRRIYCISQ